MRDKNEQERFWEGDFGNEYITRNKDHSLLNSNVALFKKVFSFTREVLTLIEFGANVGMNLKAIRNVSPKMELAGIEINETACREMAAIPGVKAYHSSFYDFVPDYPRDFVLAKGVLIHQAPDCLPKLYDLLYCSSKRYICLAEYYNPTPVEVPYRGHAGKLFKRDFAGEMLERFPSLKLINYGFIYRRDPNYPLDDITWFLLELM